jgi:uncharacterized protein (DUF58 family)
MEYGDRIVEPILLMAIMIVIAVVARQPLLFAGAAGVAAIVITRFAIATYHIIQCQNTLRITQHLQRPQVIRDRPVTLSVDIEDTRSQSREALVEIILEWSPGIQGTTRHFEIPPTQTESHFEIELTANTVGNHEIAPPTVRYTPLPEVIGATFRIGSAVSLQAAPRQPTEVRLRRGGDRSAASFGLQGGGDRDYGQGLDPSELREYVLSDPLRHIDWNTTARQNEPYVREYDPETAADLMCLISHSEAMSMGIPGQTMLDYAKEVGMGLLSVAESDGDPIGICTVDGTGDLAYRPPTTQASTHQQMRDTIGSLRPNDRYDPPAPDVPNRVLGIQDSNRRLANLDTNTIFGTTLSTFYKPQLQYRTVSADSPLLGAIEYLNTAQIDQAHLLCVCGDHDRGSVYAAAQLAATQFGVVTLFITPTVLYDPDALATPATAYETYRSFEEFRQQLERIEDVTVLEVAPGDRLDGLLSAYQRSEQ